MVSSVSPETEHTPAKVLTVSRESTPATAVRPDNESTRQAHASAPAHRCEGCRSNRRASLRRPWAVAGPGRATYRHLDRLEAAARPAGPGRASSRRAERSSRRGRRAGGQAARRPEICRGNNQQKQEDHRPRAHQAARHKKHIRHPEHQRRHEQHSTRHRNATPGIQKTDIRIGCRPVVELGGFEPPTFSLRTRRATNCAIAPRTQTA